MYRWLIRRRVLDVYARNEAENGMTELSYRRDDFTTAYTWALVKKLSSKGISRDYHSYKLRIIYFHCTAVSTLCVLRTRYMVVY